MRIKRMGVSVDLLKLMLAQDNEIPRVKVTGDGWPADAVVCGVSLHSGTVWLDISSETFEEVEQGAEIPLFSVSVTTV